MGGLKPPTYQRRITMKESTFEILSKINCDEFVEPKDQQILNIYHGPMLGRY